MGSARVISGLATRLRPDEGLVLRPGYVEGWQELRAELEQRRESRRKQRRFRQDPAAYLNELERQLPPANFATLVFFVSKLRAHLRSCPRPITWSLDVVLACRRLPAVSP